MTQKDHIINEATKMFVTEGLKSIRMDDIACRLSVSKRTLYELFGDKETLIMDCIMHNHDLVMVRVNEAAKEANNILEEVMLMLQAWDHNLEQRHKLMINLHKFYPAIHRQIMEKERVEGFPLFKAKLEEGVRQGLLIDNVNFELAINLFVSSVRSIMGLGHESYQREIPRMDVFRHMMIFFMRSITTHRGMKIIDKYLI